MVEPELTWRSGPPNTRVSGSGREEHSFGVPGSWVEVLSSYFGDSRDLGGFKRAVSVLGSCV